MTSTSPVLEVRSLSVRYGGVRALTDVDLEVRPGELVGLIGPNGAGKTTLIDAVTGFAACSGSVVLDGRELSGQAPYRRARAGLARTFQAAELFDDLSVAENVGVPRRRSVRQVAKELLSGRRTPEPVVAEALVRVGLESRADDLPEALSHAQRNLVGVARALAAEPRLLLLDEPAAGLDTTESAELGSRLRALADEGQAILMIDHDMSLVLSVCDRIVVLDFGRVIARGTPSEIQLDPKVRSAYLGTGDEDGEGNQDFASLDESLQAAVDAAVVEESDVATAESDEPGKPLLVLDGLAAGYGGGTVVRGVDLEVRAGEVVALLGPNGAGKTTTLRAVSRLIEPTAGSVDFDGEVLAGTAAHQLVRQGLVQVPENRGIFFGLTVAEHFKGAPGGPLDFGKAADYFPELEVLEHRRAGLLSGGEQQMLALALALARQPRVLLLDELSMGLAPVVVQRMLPVVRSYAKEQRAGVLLVEQHVPLALGIADRAYVLAHGSIVLSGDARDLRRDVHALMASYLGEPPAARSGALETDRGEAGRHSAIS